ncbi:MAG: tetratricopeptide repeat protein [Acidobacteriota bacterium]
MRRSLRLARRRGSGLGARTSAGLFLVALLVLGAAPGLAQGSGEDEDASSAPAAVPASETEQGDPSLASAGGAVTSTEALRRGNDLFANGDLEGAVGAYRSGYRAEAPHPTLIYNLATTLHHLDQLPEAILWYRRGEADDPWLQENLWLARRSLGSQRLELHGVPGLLARHSGTASGVAVFVAWLSFLAACVARVPRSVWMTLVSAALAAWLGAALADRYGPAEAVLLTDCTTAAGDLPAGTELWLWPASDGDLEVAGVSGARCAPETVVWIAPGP